LIRIPIVNEQQQNESMSIFDSTFGCENSFGDKQIIRRKDPLYNSNRFKFTLEEDEILNELVLSVIGYNEANLMDKE
jgi:hypothetical protein